MILYGLKTCDTCRKAAKALNDQQPTFRDVRAEPLTPTEISEFLAKFGDALVNKSSTTWRGLSEQDRGQSPERLLAEHPALMKRPVITDGDKTTLGWSAAVQKQWGL